MKSIRTPVTNRLIAIRNLTTSCTGNLLSDQELEKYGISKDLRSSIGELGYKIRTRLDSYRTVFNSLMPMLDSAAPQSLLEA